MGTDRLGSLRLRSQGVHAREEAGTKRYNVGIDTLKPCSTSRWRRPACQELSCGTNLAVGHLTLSTPDAPLAASGLQSGTTIYVDHDLKSRALISSPEGDQPTDLLGCWNDFYRVHIKKGSGWTKGVCLNQLTTCA